MIADDRDQKLWAQLGAGLGVDKHERGSWTCQIIGFFVAMLAAGIVSLVLANTWLPVWFRSVFFFGAFGGVLFITSLWCGRWEEAVERLEKNELAQAARKRVAEAAEAAKAATGAAVASAAAAGSAATGQKADAAAETAPAGEAGAGPVAEAHSMADADDTSQRTPQTTAVPESGSGDETIKPS